MGSTFLAFNDASFAAARQPAAALPVQRHLSRRERSSPRSGPGEGSARGTKGSAGSAGNGVTPHPVGAGAPTRPLPPGEVGAPNPPGVPGRRSSRCQRAGGAGRQGPALNFYRMPAHLASRAAVLDQGPPFLSAVGSPYRTWPVRAFGPYTGQTRRPSPDPLPAFRRPRRSRGRTAIFQCLFFFPLVGTLSPASPPPFNALALPTANQSCSFDHLVGAKQERLRDRNAYGPRCADIDYEREFRRLLNRHV